MDAPKYRSTTDSDRREPAINEVATPAPSPTTSARTTTRATRVRNCARATNRRPPICSRLWGRTLDRPRRRAVRTTSGWHPRRCSGTITAMALAERVTPEQAAVVFRRAAELQATGWHGEVEAVLDDTALEEIGREVGLSPASIRAALAELRDESVSFGPTVTWGTVVRSRTVAG